MNKTLPPGPWNDEPNEVDFTDEITGYPIALRRNTYGAWCGYVGVPDGHPWHGMDYFDDPDDIICHGGLTFSGAPDWLGESRTAWWFGFDCCHFGDLMPAHPEHSSGGTYWTATMVSAECRKVAAQLAKAGADQ